jgi:prostaglandin-endoperoxide synthase 2
MASKRDTSRDGLKNKVETLLLTNFKPIWSFIQSNDSLKKKVNKTLNRLRGVVYPVVASYRHQKRGLVNQEPTGNETF